MNHFCSPSDLLSVPCTLFNARSPWNHSQNALWPFLDSQLWPKNSLCCSPFHFHTAHTQISLCVHFKDTHNKITFFPCAHRISASRALANEFCRSAHGKIFRRKKIFFASHLHDGTLLLLPSDSTVSTESCVLNVLSAAGCVPCGISVCSRFSPPKISFVTSVCVGKFSIVLDSRYFAMHTKHKANSPVWAEDNDDDTRKRKKKKIFFWENAISWGCAEAWGQGGWHSPAFICSLQAAAHRFDTERKEKNFFSSSRRSVCSKWKFFFFVVATTTMDSIFFFFSFWLFVCQGNFSTLTWCVGSHAHVQLPGALWSVHWTLSVAHFEPLRALEFVLLVVGRIF